MSNTNNKINHLSINKNIESETANIKITENNNNKFKEPVQSDPRCTLPLSSSSHFCTTRSSSEPHTVESVCTAVVDTHATPTDLSHQPESDNTVNYNYNNNNIETEQCSDSPDECAPSKLLRSFILSVQCGERPFINTETEANSSDYEKNIDMNDQGTSNNQKFVSTTTTDNSSSSQYTATSVISTASNRTVQTTTDASTGDVAKAATVSISTLDHILNAEPSNCQTENVPTFDQINLSQFINARSSAALRQSNTDAYSQTIQTESLFSNLREHNDCWLLLNEEKRIQRKALHARISKHREYQQSPGSSKKTNIPTT